MATATVYVPSGSSSCLLPFQESFQDQLVCPFRLFSDHCLCTGFQSVWDSVCPLRAESISYSPPALPYARPASFQSQCSGSSSFWCKTPGLRSLMWDLDPSPPGDNLCNCDYPPVCGSPTQKCGSWLQGITDPPTWLAVPSSLCL